MSQVGAKGKSVGIVDKENVRLSLRFARDRRLLFKADMILTLLLLLLLLLLMLLNGTMLELELLEVILLRLLETFHGGCYRFVIFVVVIVWESTGWGRYVVGAVVVKMMIVVGDRVHHVDRTSCCL